MVDHYFHPVFHPFNKTTKKKNPLGLQFSIVPNLSRQMSFCLYSIKAVAHFFFLFFYLLFPNTSPISKHACPAIPDILWISDDLPPQLLKNFLISRHPHSLFLISPFSWQLPRTTVYPAFNTFIFVFPFETVLNFLHLQI